MTLDHTADAPTILVVGGEGIVGHALELLLQSADLSVRFLDYRSLDELKLLEGFSLLLFAPGLDDEHREAVLSCVGSNPLAGRTPVLELIPEGQEIQNAVVVAVPWPCRAEELTRHVEAALTVSRAIQTQNSRLADKIDPGYIADRTARRLRTE
jgi:hypothetical protein